MSNASKSAEAVLATIVVARRRIDQLATRHLPIERALAFELQRTVGFSAERQQLNMLSSIFDRRIDLLRRSLYSGAYKELATPIDESPQTPTQPIEDSRDVPSPRGLRTIAINSGDPDDVTLTDSDQVQLILDADDHEELETHAAMMEALVADESPEDAAVDSPDEEETVALNLTPEAKASVQSLSDDAPPSDEVAEDSDAAGDELGDDAMEDDIAWVVEGRPLPNSEDEASAPPLSAPEIDADSFLREASHSDEVSPEDDLDRLVLEELKRAQGATVSAPEPDADRDDDQDTDEDADIRHLLSDDDDVETPVSLNVAEGDDFSHLVIDDEAALNLPASEASDIAELTLDAEPDDAPLVVDEGADAVPLVIEEETNDDLVVEASDEVFRIETDRPEANSSSSTDDVALDALESEDAASSDPDSIDYEEPFGDLLSEGTPVEDAVEEEATLLIDAATAAAVEAVQSQAAHAEDGLEESTVLMDSSALLRALAPTPPPPSPLGQDLQPHGAAIQLLGTGQARTLGHTLELDSADYEEDFSSEWDSDEDSDEVSSTGGMSVTLEEEYEEEPLIPRLTDAHEVIEDDVSDVASFVEDINQDDISSGLAQARDVENRGDLQNAIVLYGDVLDLDPTSVEARMGRGRCTMELGDYAAAISDFQRAEDLDPTSPMPTLEMGNLFYARKDYRRAIDFYTQAINLDPSQALARVRRGMSFYYRKEYQKALTDLERAYTMDSTIPGLTASINKVSRAMARR